MDHEEENDQAAFRKLKEKSLSSVSALVVRQVLVKVIFFAGNIILARLLAPQVFGIYAIVTFVVQFFSTFGDVGIGAALIQKKGELEPDEISSTFWLQQILVCLVVGMIFMAAPYALAVYPSLPPVGVVLIRAMALSFLFTSLKTVPGILMERSMDFNKIAWVDISENLVFQAVAIACAFLGKGVWSFIFAAVARALSGAILMFCLSPWRPRFAFDLSAIGGLIRFGAPYQGNQIIAFVKDAVTPLFVGAFAGASSVGYLNWARNVAFAPLMISESFGRVAFPAFSRLQADRDLLARTVERSIRILTLVMFPVTAMMCALAPQIVSLIFTDKWNPGLGAFYFYLTSPMAIGIMLPMYSAILSLGRSGIIFRMTLLLLALEWGMGVPLVMKYGFVGVAFTQPVVTLIFFFMYRHVIRSEGIHVRVMRNIAPQLLAAMVVGTSIKMCSPLVAGLPSLFVVSAAGLLGFVLALQVCARRVIDECREYLVLAMGKGNGQV